MKKILIQNEEIDIAKTLAEVGTEEDGAVAVFIGRPRKDIEIQEVKYIDYEAFESMAVKEIEKIVDDSFTRWPITDCVIIHRFGRVELKDASILIVVSSPHREEAFLAVKYIIDTLKKTVPIWKTEHFADGSSKVYDRS